MYEFDKNEKDFLQRIGQTGNGKELKNILANIKAKVDSASSIPKDADYGAHVEGRKLVNSFLADILMLMSRKKNISGASNGIDEFY